jgi:hypothetical protein
MKTYQVIYERNDYGRINIKANSAEEARELFECGEWEEKDLNIKGGEMIAVEVTELA